MARSAVVELAAAGSACPYHHVFISSGSNSDITDSCPTGTSASAERFWKPDDVDHRNAPRMHYVDNTGSDLATSQTSERSEVTDDQAQQGRAANTAPSGDADADPAEQMQMQERHDAGICKPCMFFARSSQCINGDKCVWCHLVHKKPKARLGKIQRDRFIRFAEHLVAEMKVTPADQHAELARGVFDNGHVFLQNALKRRLDTAAFLRLEAEFAHLQPRSGETASSSTKFSL